MPGHPQKTISPRKAAIDIFCRWQSRPGPLSPLIEETGHGLKNPADVRLFLSLVHGVLRQKDSLDALISSLSSHPLKKMRPRTLWALRIGFFQILMLDRIPYQAAVNETVKALKDSRQPGWLTGFVNSILRRVAKERDMLKKKLASGHLDAPLFSHPVWLVERWKKRFNDEKTAAICQANNTPPGLVLACNTSRISPEDLLQLLHEINTDATRVPFVPGSIAVRGWKETVEELPGFDQGLFWIQDTSSQMVASLFADIPGKGTLLDCCAGVGGKTAGLLNLPGMFSICAVEPDDRRRNRLQKNMERLGFSGRTSVFSGNLDDFISGHSKREKYAGVLVDAPCSGLGVIRRHPDIRWNRTEADLEDFATNQLALLSQAAEMVQENGILVYAVCTMEPEETFAVVDRFLASHTGFRLADVSSLFPESAHFLLDNAGRTGCFLSLTTHEMDGFFAARFQQIVPAT